MKIYLSLLAVVLAGCLVFSIHAAEQDPAVKMTDKVLPPPPIYLTMRLNVGVSTTRRYCYCFKFHCNVPGMTNGFKGWVVNYVSGYAVFQGKLYRVYRCDITSYPPKP